MVLVELKGFGVDIGERGELAGEGIGDDVGGKRSKGARG